MAVVARVESSLEWTAVALTDTATGGPIADARIAHEPRDPVSWWTAFERAYAEAGGATASVGELAVAAAPGIVVLDAEREPVYVARPGDIDAASDAGWLTGQLPDGADGWAAAIGRVPGADDTISALSWLHRSEPAVWERLAHVVAPSDWLLLGLTGELVTTPGQAAATGYWSGAEQAYRFDLLAIVDRDRDWTGAVPRVVAAGQPLGTWEGIPVVAG
jgi:xylulokinase